MSNLTVEDIEKMINTTVSKLNNILLDVKKTKEYPRILPLVIERINEVIEVLD